MLTLVSFDIFIEELDEKILINFEYLVKIVISSIFNKAILVSKTNKLILTLGKMLYTL